MVQGPFKNIYVLQGGYRMHCLSVLWHFSSQGRIRIHNCKEEPPRPSHFSLAPLAPMYCVFLKVIVRV